MGKSINNGKGGKRARKRKRLYKWEYVMGKKSK